MKRRLFATDANHAFHLLDQPSISSPPPVLVTPLSIQSPSPSRRTKHSARPSSSLPAKPTTAKSAPSRKRPASVSLILEDDVDDDDDAPLIIRRKVIKLVYLQVYFSTFETFLYADDLLDFSKKLSLSFKGFGINNSFSIILC